MKAFHHFMANERRKSGSNDKLFSWAPKSLWKVTAAMKLKDTAPWKKSYDKTKQHINKKKPLCQQTPV